MMRVLVIILSFTTLMFGLLLLQPHNVTAPVTAFSSDTSYSSDTIGKTDANADKSAEDLPAISGQVTRGQTELLQIATAPIEQAAPRSAAPKPVVRAATLTRQPREVTQTRIAPKQEEDELRTMTSGILAGLGIVPADPVQETRVASLTPTVETGDAQRAMTNGVLSGLRAATAQTETTGGLQQIIVQALKAGESDAYIDALLNAAKIKGDIQVPEALVTNTGKVDTSVILASVVQSATGEPAKPTASVGGPGVEVRVVQHIDGTVQYRFYTVQSGDSLGAIAIKFYGDMRHYTTIYEANRQVIVSPDRIRAGQRLSIPTI